MNVEDSQYHSNPVSIQPTEPDKPKLLEQVRTVMRTRNYNPRTIKTYVQWIKRFILFHNKTNPAELDKSHLPLSIAETGLGVGSRTRGQGAQFAGGHSRPNPRHPFPFICSRRHA